MGGQLVPPDGRVLKANDQRRVLAEANEFKKERNTSQLPRQLCCTMERVCPGPSLGGNDSRVYDILPGGACGIAVAGEGLASPSGGRRPPLEADLIMAGGAAIVVRVALGVSSSNGGRIYLLV